MKLIKSDDEEHYYKYNEIFQFVFFIISNSNFNSFTKDTIFENTVDAQTESIAFLIF